MSYRRDPDFFSHEVAMTGNLVIDHWNGMYSLPRSYWLHGIVLANIVGYGILFLLELLANAQLSIQSYSALWILGQAAILATWFWSTVGTWRSADRYAVSDGSTFWALIAKLMLVIGLIAVVTRLITAAPAFSEHAQLAAGSDSMGAPAEVTLSDGNIRIEGPLSAGSADAFNRVFQQAPTTNHIYISSIGGRIREAQDIAAIVQREKMAVEVDGECLSACTLVLLAGERRWAGRDSKIGFHQYDFPGIDADERSELLNDMWRDFRASGLSDQFIERMMNTPPSGMWYPSERELFKAGVLTGYSKPRLERELLEASNETNLNTPMRIDNITTLLRTSVSGASINYRYRVDVRLAELNAEQARREIAASVTKNLCEDGLSLRAIRSGAVYRYEYEDLDGEIITEFSIDHCDQN